LYTTTWDNAASQAVARQLGMLCYADDWSKTESASNPGGLQALQQRAGYLATAFNGSRWL
jgi:hypothetical protein